MDDLKSDACCSLDSHHEPSNLQHKFVSFSNKLIKIVKEKDIFSLGQLDGVKGVAAALGTEPENGIRHDDQEIRKRQEIFGSNTYQRLPPKGFFYFLVEAFQEGLVKPSLFVAPLSLVLGIKEHGFKEGWWYDVGKAFALSFLLALDYAFCNFRQEAQFGRLLKKINNIKVDVLRDGCWQPISRFDLVVGDVVSLKIGDQIPADGLLLTSETLQVDESSMTGESDLVEVDSDRNPFLLSGSKLVDGYAQILVVSVGMNTAWGEKMSSITRATNEMGLFGTFMNKYASYIVKVEALLMDKYRRSTMEKKTEDMAASTSNISPNGRFKRNITGWEKGELLGRGSFGSVYEGISGDGFLFALKEVSLLDQGSQGKQSIFQLEQEIDLLSKFKHENIVQYYGSDKDESKIYIFLELVKEGSLLSLYKRYNLKDSQVSSYAIQILHGLKYLHHKGVVHRDIKCANILVNARGSVKLADFGLAKVTRSNDVKSFKGTAFWMAPEVVKSQGYGLPADIWSLGCTVLEMLTRKVPYSPLEWQQALFKIGKGEPPPVPDSLSDDARDFILQCLQVNPNSRPTAAQLLDHSFVRSSLSTS